MSSPNTHKAQVGRHTIITMEDQSLPLVRFVVASPYGALSDPDGLSGETYLTWELSLRGTQGKSRAEFSRQLEGLGSSLTAAVGDETSSIRGLCLERQFDETLDLLREAMLEPAYRQQEIDDLRDELIDDLVALSDDDASLCALFWRRSLFEGTLRARIPGGERADLSRIERTHLTDAHSMRMVEGPLIWVFTGAVTPELARQKVLERWPVTDQETEPLPALPDCEAPRQGRIVVVDKPERTQVQLRVGQLVMSGLDEKSEAFWLGSTAFGGTFTSPFNTEVRDKRGWSYFASSEFRRNRRSLSPMILHTAPAVDDLLDCLALELELLGNLANGKLPVEEIERAREYMLNRYPLSIASAADRMIPTLLGELLGRPPESLFGLPERLEALSPAEVAGVMKERLNLNEVLVVMVATADKVVPGLKERFGHLDVEVIDYRDGLGSERAGAPAEEVLCD
ncbi:MAG: pitrilysin family protein [Myxococcota bacterium]|nr:pitrilysin family protein [Myxococcota bacterium]